MPTFALEVAVLGVLSGLVGILYFEALKRISSLLVAVIVSLEVVFTMIIEHIFLDMLVSWLLLAGAILVMVGAVFVGREAGKLKLDPVV